MSKLRLKETQESQELISKRLAEYIAVAHQARERVAQAEHERSAMGMLVQGWKAREESAENDRALLAKKLQESDLEKQQLMAELHRLKNGLPVERDGTGRVQSESSLPQLPIRLCKLLCPRFPSVAGPPPALSYPGWTIF